MASLKKIFNYSIGTIWNQKKSIYWLIKNKGPRAAWNYTRVKLFVREGEGAKGSIAIMLSPLWRRFPSLCPYPYNFEIEITHRCNKRCITCEHTYWKEDTNWDLKYEDFKRIADYFPKLIWVNLTGEGDSFLNKDYLKMIKYCKDKNLVVYLVESFDLINENTAEKLIKLNVNGIYISFDAATKETYEKIKVGCKFDRTIKNIKKMLELKKKYKTPFPHLHFRYVYTKLNYKEIPDFISLVASLGTREELGEEMDIGFTGLLSFPEIEKYHLKFEEIPKKIIDEAHKRSKKHKIPIKFEVNYRRLNINKCIAWMEPYIMRDGYVMPCCGVLMSNKRDFLRKHALGNVNEKTFKEIWNSKKYKVFKKYVTNPRKPVPSICANCRPFDTCYRQKKHGIIDISKIK